MKTYNKFIIEAYTAYFERKDIQEAVPLVVGGALKLGGMALSAYQAYEAAKKLKKGDYKGAAVDAALAIPSAGAAGKVGQALKWGQKAKKVTTNTMRAGKAATITKQTADEFSEASYVW